MLTSVSAPVRRATPSRAAWIIVTVVCAATSIAALLLHAAGMLAMPYAVAFITGPGLVVLLGIMAWARRVDHHWLRTRLFAGTVAGFIGLVGYDVGRWLITLALPMNFDPFIPILSFGTLITGKPISDPAAIIAGWAYHISNGWTFAVIYALIAGSRSWWWGLAWGACLELGMIIVYPVIFQIAYVEPFLAVSIAGHVIYGGLLGWWCQRHAFAGGSS